MIKNLLKQNGISLIQFANDLNISRPTLDVYIKSYEQNNLISNQLYQNIFDFLFNASTLSSEEFLNKYDYVKTYYGNKDNNLSSLHSQSISLHDNNDDYIKQCNKIIDLINSSIEKNRFSMDKLISIEKILIEELPDFEVIYEKNNYAVIKRKNINNFYLCLKKLLNENECFKSEDVFIMGNYKYCLLKENSDKEYLISLINIID